MPTPDNASVVSSDGPPESFLEGLRSDPSIQVDSLPDTFITVDGQPAVQTSQGPFLLMDEASVRNRKWRPTATLLDFSPRHTEYVNADAFIMNIQPATLGVSLPPDQVTHPVPMLAVRNQGPHRNTCVAHATVAAMEMQLGGGDLSEQCAHHHLMVTAATPTTCCVDGGVFVIDAGNDLTGYGIPNEGAFPYTLVKPSCNTGGTCSVSPHRDPLGPFTSTHKIAKIGEIPPGTTGATIGNIGYLESIIAAGFDIVYEFWYAIFDEDADIIDVHMFKSQPMVHGNAAHAVLLTGYNRTKQFFIARNSFGPDWGDHNGDMHLSYRYMTTYGIAGFIINQLA